MAKTAGSNEASETQASAIAAPVSYEAALTELEALVGRMEGGALSLEDSLDAYRRGAALVGFCQQQLEKVEQQVRVLDGDTLKPLPAEVQRATQGAGTASDNGDDLLISINGCARVSTAWKRRWSIICRVRTSRPPNCTKPCATRCSAAASGFARCCATRPVS